MEKLKTLQEMDICNAWKRQKMNKINNLCFQWKVDLIHIHQNFPFALQSRVQSSHLIKMLPLTLQSEIGTSDNTLIKGNC